jgi:hypothetical protein
MRDASCRMTLSVGAVEQTKYDAAMRSGATLTRERQFLGRSASTVDPYTRLLPTAVAPAEDQTYGVSLKTAPKPKTPSYPTLP